MSTIRNKVTGLYIGNKAGAFGSIYETSASRPHAKRATMPSAMAYDLARLYGRDYEVVHEEVEVQS